MPQSFDHSDPVWQNNVRSENRQVKVRIVLQCLNEETKGVFTITDPEMTKSSTIQFLCQRESFLFCNTFPLGECLALTRGESYDPVRRNGKIEILPCNNKKSGYPYCLPLDVDHRASAGPRRYRGCQLDNIPESRNLTHR